MLATIVPFFLLFFLDAGLEPPASAQSKAHRQIEWEKTLEGARKEGEVTLYASSGYDTIAQEFSKKYPEIKVTMVLGPGHQIGSKITLERRAGRYLTDVYVGGSGTAYRLFYLGKMLDPVPPTLILPEVRDESRWFQGKHHYADSEARYLLIFEGTVQTGGVSYNTNLVKPNQIRSYWNLLDAKQKGKIVAMDPKARGPVSQNLRFFYYNPELGPEFVKRLFGEMEIVLTRDDRQLLDWLGVGRYAYGLFARGTDTASQQGLPVQEFIPGHFREGAFIDQLRGTLAFFNKAPHPNAAKVFINWLLARDGQMVFQKHFAGSGASSMREDIPVEEIPPGYRRLKGGKYLFTGRPDWIDMTPIYKIIDDALSAGKKR